MSSVSVRPRKTFVDLKVRQLARPSGLLVCRGFAKVSNAGNGSHRNLDYRQQRNSVASESYNAVVEIGRGEIVHSARINVYGVPDAVPGPANAGILHADARQAVYPYSGELPSTSTILARVLSVTALFGRHILFTKVCMSCLWYTIVSALMFAFAYWDYSALRNEGG
ncbi:hypothetical protein AB1N83_006839 [Pleurotus pulmonarius]